ncbi:hypothetical protein H6F89_30500 [Cyanobacteria bacterium FACHB-63]|nr:hypothetical protein [Cyanobacteria bacterium FACHB-63]
MTEAKMVCSVNVGKGMLDDFFTLYGDGRVHREYDKNTYSLSNHRWLTAADLSQDIKEKLLDECPDELKDTAQILLGI